MTEYPPEMFKNYVKLTLVSKLFLIQIDTKIKTNYLEINPEEILVVKKTLATKENKFLIP